MSGTQWPSEAPAPAPGLDGLASMVAHEAGAPPDTRVFAGQAGADATAASSVQRPTVLIVGGSMGGCCAALALGRIGCRVDVFEKAPGELQSQGAGLVVQPDLAAFLKRTCAVDSIVSVEWQVLLAELQACNVIHQREI